MFFTELPAVTLVELLKESRVFLEESQKTPGFCHLLMLTVDHVGGGVAELYSWGTAALTAVTAVTADPPDLQRQSQAKAQAAQQCATARVCHCHSITQFLIFVLLHVKNYESQSKIGKY